MINTAFFGDGLNLFFALRQATVSMSYSGFLFSKFSTSQGLSAVLRFRPPPCQGTYLGGTLYPYGNATLTAEHQGGDRQKSWPASPWRVVKVELGSYSSRLYKVLALQMPPGSGRSVVFPAPPFVTVHSTDRIGLDYTHNHFSEFPSGLPWQEALLGAVFLSTRAAPSGADPAPGPPAM
jgi:hypothetical protein